MSMNNRMTFFKNAFTFGFLNRRCTLISLLIISLPLFFINMVNATIFEIEESPLAPQRELSLPLVQAGNLSVANTTLKSYEGKVILLDFWASWCGPCRESFPWMNKIQAKYKQQDLVIVAINLDVNSESAYDFLKAIPAEFDILLDSNASLQESFNVIGMPTSFLLDRKGRIRAQHIGFHLSKTDSYETDIKTLLDEKELVN